MTKKGKSIIAVSAVTVVAVSVIVGVAVCRKIYEKKYFSVN